MIELKQGEGHVFEQEVTDSSIEGGLANLTGAEAWLSIRKVSTSEIKYKLCSITLETSVVKGVLPGTATQNPGHYQVEMKIWLNDLPVVLMQDEVWILESEMPTKPTTETL